MYIFSCVRIKGINSFSNENCVLGVNHLVCLKREHDTRLMGSYDEVGTLGIAYAFLNSRVSIYSRIDNFVLEIVACL